MFLKKKIMKIIVFLDCFNYKCLFRTSFRCYDVGLFTLKSHTIMDFIAKTMVYLRLYCLHFVHIPSFFAVAAYVHSVLQ